ncbi:MAG: chromosome segregation protein SMC [Calditrichaceae bacterium]
MYLSKLDILGFKSFAQKTKLEFSGGLTCVIGPNGSGKSNIVDAIRWVLGEQRVSSLRSDKMENVIFNGTKTRKPVGMTEVSMTIQNNKNILDTEFHEVVISRRLYRSGESQYLINKTPVRLKDVLDLFMDTGMGANSYSVIELKMVESILSENKQERRQLFEEAAGVVKYKVRRKSALKKLDATRIDLTRINDIITEVDKTVSSLSRQVAKARRYLSLNEELKKCEVDLSRLRYHRLLESIRPLEVQLKEASKLKEESSHQITMDEALLEDYKREQIKTEQALQKINTSIHELDAEIARINQADAVAKTKAEENTKTRDRYKVEIEDYENKIVLLEENVVQYQNELDQLVSQKEIIDRNYSEIESERLKELEKLQKEKADIDKLNSEFRLQLQSLSNMKEVLKQKEYQLGFLTEQVTTIDENIASRSEALKTKEAELNNYRKDRQTSEMRLKELNDKLQDLNVKSNQLQEKSKSAETERQTLHVETEKVRSRQSFFQHIIANYEGHSKSTQFVMTQKDQIKGIHGPLAELISVDENYAQLVELVLGEALNYILVEDIDSAKKMIQLVRESDKGRITCIPLNRTSFIKIPELPEDLNSLTLLSDLIVTDDKYRHLIKILLGDVAVVDNFNEALILSEKYPNLRLATSSGEMVNFNREISGGSVSKKQTTIIGRHDQLKKYTRQLQEFEKNQPKVEKII